MGMSNQTEEKDLFHAVSLSGGKDSTAMLLLMVERGLPIHAVLTADTGMEFPEMYEHLQKLDDYLFTERGLHLTWLRHPKGFEWLMFEEKKQRPASIENRQRLGVSLWYVDRLGDLRCDAVHHDGTNHYLYRAYKENVSEAQIDRLKEKLYSGTATRADVTRVTKRLGDEIGRVYGWRFPPVREAARER